MLSMYDFVWYKVCWNSIKNTKLRTFALFKVERSQSQCFTAVALPQRSKRATKAIEPRSNSVAIHVVGSVRTQWPVHMWPYPKHIPTTRWSMLRSSTRRLRLQAFIHRLGSTVANSFSKRSQFPDGPNPTGGCLKTHSPNLVQSSFIICMLT